MMHVGPDQQKRIELGIGGSKRIEAPDYPPIRMSVPLGWRPCMLIPRAHV